jgi:hypothetical protein
MTYGLHPPSEFVNSYYAKELSCAFTIQPRNKTRAGFIGEQVEFCSNPHEVAVDAGGLLVLTDWAEFKCLDLRRIKSAMRGNLLLDARNIYDPDAVSLLGFVYHGTGRAPMLPAAARGCS